MAHLPLKDPPQPQAWASDRAPGFVLPAGGAPQSSQGAGHGSHGSWPRPHKHRGLPGPGQPGANPGVFTKDGDPSWNLRPPPLFHTQLCVLQTTKPSMSVDRGGTTVSPVPATSLADTPCAASSQDICGTHAPAPPQSHTHAHGSGGRGYVQRIYLSKLGSEAERGFSFLSLTCLLRFPQLTGTNFCIT